MPQSKAVQGSSRSESDRHSNEFHNRPISEDQRFFEFAREHVGMLLAFTSIPAISHITGALPPPNHGDAKLTLISSVLCLAAFWAVLSANRLISMATQDDDPKRILWPILFSAFWLVVSVGAISCYLTRHSQNYKMPASEEELCALIRKASLAEPDCCPTDVALADPKLRANQLRLHTITYLGIFPALVLSLSTLFVMRFSLTDVDAIDYIVRNKLLKHAHDIKQMLKSFSNYLRLTTKRPGNEMWTGREALEKVGKQLFENSRCLLSQLGEGQIEVTKSLVGEVQDALLMKHTLKQFDAVSDRDLKFWIEGNPDDTSKSYFKSNRDALNKRPNPIEINRIFIFDIEDLHKQQEAVAKVLVRHSRHGIGWGVAVHEDLGDYLRVDQESSLDFGIFDRGTAVSFFRDYRVGNRRLRVWFNVSRENKQEIDKKWDLFKRIAQRCWIVSDVFRDRIFQDSIVSPTDLRVPNDIANSKAFREQLPDFLELRESFEKLNPTPNDASTAAKGSARSRQQNATANSEPESPANEFPLVVSTRSIEEEKTEELLRTALEASLKILEELFPESFRSS